jgi:hypothetical protein
MRRGLLSWRLLVNAIQQRRPLSSLSFNGYLWPSLVGPYLFQIPNSSADKASQQSRCLTAQQHKQFLSVHFVRQHTLSCKTVGYSDVWLISKGKGKAIPLQALTGPEGSSSLRLPDLKTVGTWRWQWCQPYAPAAFTSRKYSWYSFLLEAECGRKGYVNDKVQWYHRESTPSPSGL